jgi:hypothetical protein
VPTRRSTAKYNSAGVEVFDLSPGAIGGAQDQEGGVRGGAEPLHQVRPLSPGRRRLHLIAEAGQLVVERGSGTIIPVHGRDSSHPAPRHGSLSGEPIAQTSHRNARAIGPFCDSRASICDSGQDRWSHEAAARRPSKKRRETRASASSKLTSARSSPALRQNTARRCRWSVRTLPYPSLIATSSTV